MMKAPFKRVRLTQQEQRWWADTLAALSWIAPGFTHIIYTMLANSGDDDLALFTHDIDATAATDGWQLIFNPKHFFKYTLMERVFIVLHEVMHEILNHVRIGWKFKLVGTMTLAGRTIPYDHMFANIMQDFVINAILIASKMGKFNPDWLHNETIATEHSQWMEVYFKQWKDRPQIKINLSCDGDGKGDGKPGDKKGKGKGTGDLRGPRKPDPADGKGGKPEDGDAPPTSGSPHQFDAHLDPNQSKGDDPNEVPERNEAQWEMAIKAGMEIQIAQGKMPAAMKMFFDEVLRPKVDWTDHVRGILLRIAGSGAFDWRKLDRRLVTRGIGAPGQTGHGAGVIVIGGDTSMSVYHNIELPKRFVGEIGGMVEDVGPEEAHVVWCDTEVKRVDVCTDMQDVKKMVYDGIPGGGGTDFRPVFKYIEDNDLRPDALIYLTDGEGAFPKREPDFPVIWGDISHGKTKYPWGIVVDIPTTSSADD